MQLGLILPLTFYKLEHLKLITVIVFQWNSYVYKTSMCHKDADRMANNIGPDQTAPSAAV